MPSHNSNDNEPGLVSQEWLNQKRLDLERSMLRARASNPEDSNPVPTSFVEFARNWLAVELTPAHRVLCLVAFDGLEPEQLVGEERELARQLFGDLEVIPPTARDVIAVIIGSAALIGAGIFLSVWMIIAYRETEREVRLQRLETDEMNVRLELAKIPKHQPGDSP